MRYAVRGAIFLGLVSLIIVFQNCGGFGSALVGSSSLSSAVVALQGAVERPALRQKTETPDGARGWQFIDDTGVAKLEALIAGRARLSRVRAMPPDPGGSWILVKDGVWYLYDRYDFGDLERAGTRDFCKGGVTATGKLQGTIVRQSRDRGQTWTEPTYVAWPTGTRGDPDACTVVDGATFFDVETGLWHLWAQCMGETGSPWRMCHYTSTSGTGPFRRNSFIENGAVWGPICGPAGERCGGPVGDEGTPEILYKKNGYFYVSFHGFRASDGHGFRGTAKTRDFRTFVTDAPDVPTGPSLTGRDCSTWNPGCIGFGAASSLLTDREIFLLSEGPTRTLDCVAGQNWSWGAMRGSMNTATGAWTQLRTTPLIAGTPGVKCDVAYLKMFQDGADLFAFYTRNGTSETGRDYSLYQVQMGGEERAVTPTMPAREVVATRDVPPAARSHAVSPPLLDYVIPNSGNARFPMAAWVGARSDLAQAYCQKKFGSSWRADLTSLKIESVQANICNVRLDTDESGRLQCAEGISGSFVNRGYVYTEITCREN